MTGWWRSNAIALGAIAVLVPAIVATMAWNERAEIDANSASRPVDLAEGDTVEYAGATIGPVAAELADRTELPLAPQGTRVVAVTIPVDPGDAPLACLAPMLRETDGRLRQWYASDDLGREWDADRRTFCDSESTAPYVLELDYLLPADASGPFAVELESAAAWPEFVRAVVEP